MSELFELASLALAAGDQAGALLRTRFAAASVAANQRRDVKLEEDSLAERIIIARLETSGIPIFAEESAVDHVEALKTDRIWVVDPLDGSFNYSRGFDRCVVSIGLVENGHPVLGVIVDFLRGQAFLGGRGLPAKDRSGAPVHVSSIEKLADAALLTGLPVQRDFSASEMDRFARGLSSVKKVRMIGSAASSLLLVARGVFDLYVEEDIMIWDVAAGAALVESAGGAVSMTASDRVEGAVRLIAGARQSLVEAYDVV